MHGLFLGFRTANPSVVFSVTLLQPNAHKAQSHPRACGGLEPCQPSKQKDVGTPTTTTVPTCARKNNPKLH
ncbi:MAG: hypothetical protein IPP61_17935 [Cytophagaceae bacterium]|nr:hypothetical protein [Cytophagaceae bacterium]